MAVKAGSQVFSKSCTKSCIEFEMTLKINKTSLSRIRLTKIKELFERLFPSQFNLIHD